MKYRYQGFDQRGKEVAGLIEAGDPTAAREQLRRDGLFVDEVRPARSDDERVHTGKSGRAFEMPSLGGGRRLRAMSGFTRQLAVLVSTGTPLVDAIASLEKQERDRDFRKVLADVHQRIEQGTMLSDAVAAHPRYFGAVARSLIAAGEQGGQLDAMLARLAKLARQQQKVRSTVTGAMIYPALLVCVSLGVVTAMLFFVLPRFEGLFQTLQTPLPSTTRMLMDVSHVLRDNWAWWAAGLVVCVLGVLIGIGTRSGKRGIMAAALRVPVVGTAIQSLATARIARVLGVLLDGKVQMVDALQLTRDATGVDAYAALVTRAEDFVLRGDAVSAAWEGSRLIPASVVEAVRSGERTGRVGTVLLSLADNMDEDNEMAIKTATHVLEPVILIVLGLIVGVMAISMFLPLFDLTAAGGH